ncbi:DUF262 domain-containing protein [Micromonospora sp. HM5-17]|jgi:hypothetical protein|uniref:DUF262 domain-containing protein n=1 Tax=Micromonospora sp. HM5-17 TaxID=2487710 RepID=UPI000F4718CF|nr:DUF262 domain-containing protein [Micromonospora sp. HM5-17]ROT31844.1 DUF262 domain-containing protein [Micromonospora sp. HM5-17]
MAVDSQSRATTLDVEGLVNMAWAGKIRVPRFQRSFRWSWEDVRRLFDSIVQGYPIGSLLLWTRSAPAQRLQLGELRIDAPADSAAFWVVDGQQRITSLANALHPEGRKDRRFALAYDLRTETFVRTPAGKDPLVIPLPVLFNLQELLKWFSANPGISEYVDKASAITRRLRQFQVPAYEVSQDDPTVLQDIFDRMNNYGKRLSRAEIFSALNAQEEDGKLTIDRIAENIDRDLGFGAIDGNTVLQAVLARRGTDVKRDIRHEFAAPDDEGGDAAFAAGEEALRRAVTFLQQECSVPHFTMLAYRYLLVPLARLFAHYPDLDARNRRLLRRWYWRAAVAGPQQFKAGTGDAARLLCTKVRTDDLSASIQGLLDLVEQKNPSLPRLQGFATNQAATKIVLCSWWAAEPRSPETGEPYQIADLADVLRDQATARDAVRYLIPSRQVPKRYRPEAANRVLMPALSVDSEEVGGLLLRQPTEDMTWWPAMLRSHALTGDIVAHLRKGEVGEALTMRQHLLATSLDSFLERMCEWRFEDTPPLFDLLIEDEDEGDDADY